MKIEFANSRGERRELADVATFQGVTRVIHAFLQDHNYTSPYWRYCMEGGELMIDVGSHTEFFYVTVPAGFDLDAALHGDN